MITKYTLVIISIIIITIIGVTIWSNSTLPDDLSIQKKYETKIIYTTSQSITKENKTLYIEDCRSRGGTFNDCGSPCAPDAEICTQVCAYTCDLE